MRLPASISELPQLIKQADNAVVAPDLAADGSSSFYTIDISKWAEFNVSKKHLTLCLVTLHRVVRKYGDVAHNQALYHYHQACAAEILSRKIQTSVQMEPNLELFEDVSLFFFSQIQASAYGAWKAHLSAAKTLFNLWGVEVLMGNVDYEFFLCHLVLADVFGTSMATTTHISAADVSQHKTYLELLGRFSVDVCSTMVPIPEAIVRATAAMNITRAAGSVSSLQTVTTEQHPPLSISSIFESLQSFDPAEWATHRPRHTYSQAPSWTLLATCFQSATILYFIHCSEMDISGVDEDLVLYHHTQLKNAVCDLYDLKKHGGVLYKYILWPMVVNGVEAVMLNDEEHLRFLCELLEQTTIDLGTLSMREASIFLEELWVNNKRRTAERSNELPLDWDTIFVRAPLFLM